MLVLADILFFRLGFLGPNFMKHHLPLMGLGFVLTLVWGEGCRGGVLIFLFLYQDINTASILVAILFHLHLKC